MTMRAKNVIPFVDAFAQTRENAVMNRRTVAPTVRPVLWMLLVLLVSVATVTPVLAATITVNTFGDEDAQNSQCSLREAIIAANSNAAYRGCAAGSGADVIILPAGTYTLDSFYGQLPVVNSPITINGGSRTSTFVQASTCDPVSGGCTPATYRVLEIDGSGILTINALTIRYGNCPNSLACTSNQGNPDNYKGFGGAIFNGGSLTVTSSNISRNKSASTGGGIYQKQGTLTMTGTDVQDNVAFSDGGGISANGNVTVTTSNVAFNVAGVSGGGISTSGGVLTVNASDFNGNSATGSGGAIVGGGRLIVDKSTIRGNSAARGGGIFNSGGGPGNVSSITNSTIHSNTASSSGGGVFNYEDLNLTNSTFSGNAAATGGGFYSDPYQHQNDEFRLAVVTIKNTILANSTTGRDCFNFANGSPVPITGLKNLIEADSLSDPCLTTAPINNTDPNLGTLTGSPSPQYYPLLAGSPAIDAGDNATCLAPPVSLSSQNGVSRPQGAACDIGAFEGSINNTPPTMALDKTTLRFGAVPSGAAFLWQTSAQVVRLTQTGVGTVTWTAAANQPWLQVSPASGTGSANLSVSVVSAGGLPVGSTVTGAITVTLTGAANTAGPITVALNLIQSGTQANPFGVVDTPLNNATGVTGAIPVTGWALDDVEVTRVTVCRAAFGTEVAPVDPNCGGAAQIFIGTAVFVEGARPDVAAAHPAAPLHTRAGWGLMVLTNMLPAQGNGTYQFLMWAQDRDGHTVPLGTRTLTCANASATKPFGAIDTPTQGGTASGSAYVNFGWALTPWPKTIPVTGATITVQVDGVTRGTATYNQFRSDIATLFPGLNNTNGAVGFRAIDTTTLSNGVHTIDWIVTDNQGAAEGIGSRFFTVVNGAGAPLTAAAARAGLTRAAAGRTLDTVPLDEAALRGRRGWDLAAPLRAFAPTASGRTIVRSEEVNRVEFQLGPGWDAGYLRTSEGLAALPIGSHLDATTGVFTWAPGVGFIGAYDLVFVQHQDAQAVARREVRVLLAPKGSGRVGPQVVLDTPTSQQDVGQPFALGGWAADLSAATGTGIATLHAWAYPLAGGPPVFLGATSYGGARPDVAAVHGDQFTASGFGLTVQGLAHGHYDLAVFAWSTEAADFVPATVVRVTVR